MTEDQKNALRGARDSVKEIRSLQESLTEIEGRLFDAKGARSFDAATPGTYNPTEREELLDRRRELQERITAAHYRECNTLMRAEEIIEGVEKPRSRAALRYYYLCGKTVEQIAELMERSEKTVRRYLYS